MNESAGIMSPERESQMPQSSQNILQLTDDVDESASDMGTVQPPVDELDLYLNQTYSAPDEEFKIEEYWRKNEAAFPKLSLFAKKVLSLPASSSSAERKFKELKHAVRQDRTNLLPKNVSKIVMGHSLIDLELD